MKSEVKGTATSKRLGNTDLKEYGISVCDKLDSYILGSEE